jgi:putative ABC transport system substrate-binding protein
MKRREFIAFVGGAAVWPVVARAQQGKLRRMGLLVGYAENDPESKARLAGLRAGLEGLGWFEGRNLHIDYRYAPANMERARALARDLVALRPEVILAQSPGVVSALQRETKEIPIVFVGVTDPIAMGVIASIARPGGNLTGLIQSEGSISGKWLSMLKEIAPSLLRVAFVGNPNGGTYTYFKRTIEELAPSFGLEIVPSPITNAAEAQRAIAALANLPGSAFIIPPDTTAQSHRDLIISLAARHRLPAVYQARYWVDAGGLMSYGTDRVAEHRQAAAYIDRILRGEKPADLPVQTPIKFETVLNLKTAKALGLVVPPGLLIAADEVIE